MTLVYKCCIYPSWLLGKLSQNMKPCVPKSEPSSTILLSLTTSTLLTLPSTTCFSTFEQIQNPVVLQIFRPHLLIMNMNQWVPIHIYIYHSRVYLSHWCPSSCYFSSLKKTNNVPMFWLSGNFYMILCQQFSSPDSPLTTLMTPYYFKYWCIV